MRPSSPLARKLGVDFLWNVGSLAVLGVSGIVLHAIIGRFAGAGALGVFNQVFAFYIFLSQLGVGGIQFSVLKHVSHHQDESQKCAEITLAGALLAAGLSGLVALVAFAGSGLAGQLMQSPGVAAGLAVAAPGLVAFAVNKVLVGAINGLHHMRAFAVFQAARVVLLVSGVAWIVAAGWPADRLAAALTFAEWTLLVALAIYVHRVLPLFPAGGLRPWFREHLSFGSRGFLSGALIEANSRVDVLVLGLFRDDRVVGIYSFAAILAEGFAQLAYVVRRNLDPLFGDCFARGDKERIERYARQVKRVFFPTMVLIGGVAIWLYRPALGLVVPGRGFTDSAPVFAILMVGVVANALYRPFLGLLPQGGRPGAYTLLISVVILVNLVGNVLLIPTLGMTGAAVATAVALLVEAGLAWLAARRLFGIRL